MEIKISNDESHIIKVPDVLTIEEFKGLMIKLKELDKFIEKFFDISQSQNQSQTQLIRNSPQNNRPKIYRKRLPPENRPWTISKEQAIKALKIHYFGSREEKELYAKSVERDWVDITKGLYIVKNKFDIKPEDIGLNRFPRKHESHTNMEELKLR